MPRIFILRFGLENTCRPGVLFSLITAKGVKKLMYWQYRMFDVMACQGLRCHTACLTDFDQGHPQHSMDTFQYKIFGLSHLPRQLCGAGSSRVFTCGATASSPGALLQKPDSAKSEDLQVPSQIFIGALQDIHPSA